MEHSEIPEFEQRPVFKVLPLINSVFSAEGANTLVRLLTFPDGHFRVVFRASYFALQEGMQEPTKSQWNTLKKKLKRRDRRIFIFKEHGVADCGEPAGEKCFYLDFGFFRYA